MGGGNGQKSKMAREMNLEKQKAAAKGSQLELNKKSMSIQCTVCMRPFICTPSEASAGSTQKPNILNLMSMLVSLTLRNEIMNEMVGDGAQNSILIHNFQVQCSAFQLFETPAH